MNYRQIIREVIEDYIGNDGIKAVLFDFDYTLVNTSSLVGVNRDYIRATNDISNIKDKIQQTKVYDGIETLLNYLYSNGIKVGIVSNRNELIVNEVLKFHGLKFNVVIGEKLNCPKSVRMRNALSKLGVKPNNAIYIGDSPWDNAEAHKAGMEFIGATWGNKKLYMGYNSPKEIIQYIEYMNN